MMELSSSKLLFLLLPPYIVFMLLLLRTRVLYPLWNLLLLLIMLFEYSVIGAGGDGEDKD